MTWGTPQFAIRLRVEIMRDGLFNLHDVQSGAAEYALKLPEHIERKLALLMMVDNDTEIKGVGYRYTDKVFYVDKAL